MPRDPGARPAPVTVAVPRPRRSPDDAASGYDATVQRVLSVARTHLGMEVAWASAFDGAEQVFSHVDAAVPGAGPRQGSSGDLAGSFCVRVLDGRLPNVVPDARADPVTRDLPVTSALGIGSYVGVPIARPGGPVRGMLCCTSTRADASVAARDLAVLEMLAGILAELAAAPDDQQESLLEARTRVLEAVAGVGRSHVVQPIVDVLRGAAVGVESLARFALPPHRPDAWFAEADRVNLRLPLEVAAARTALEMRVPRAGAHADPGGHQGYVSVNLSPDVVTSRHFASLLEGVDLSRVVLEITEHAPVDDYDLLREALRGPRAAGLRVAVDDAGAGFASFRHILKLTPDYIKVDISLVRDLHLDPVRQALTKSLVTFARDIGATLVAEGVETQAELDTLVRLGVRFMQGYLLSRPCDDPPADGYPMPSRDVLFDDGSDLGVVLAEVVRGRGDLEARTRPLLDAALRLTGLETSYVTVMDGDDLDHRYVRNVGSIELPEGVRVPWADSLCSGMQERDLLWTAQAQRDLAHRPLVGRFGVQTFLSAPIRDHEGRLLGTLCAGSRRPVTIDDSAVAQVQLIAQILAGVLGRDRPLAPAG